MVDTNPYHNGDQLFDGRYRFIKPLGNDGSVADVWLAIDTSTIENYSLNGAGANAIDESSGLRVVIKIYQTTHTLGIEDQQHFREEYELLHKCHHANLLHPIDFSVFEGSPYFVYPYCEAGSAEMFKEKKMPKAALWKFISDVASGLDKLHTNSPQIIHLAIKPSHILINDDGNFVITNYGKNAQEARRYENYYEKESRGNLSYTAPEYCKPNGIPSSKSDIWAFGATMYQLLTGDLPFGEDGGKAQTEGYRLLPSLKGLPKSIQKLIVACLQFEPELRPTAHEIVEMAKKKKFGVKRNKKTPLFLTLGALLLALTIVVIYKQVNTPSPLPVVVYDYNMAVKLLSEETTGEKGWRILNSLAEDKNNHRPVFLMSRLYCTPPTENDSLFIYDPVWETMRSNAKIEPNDSIAHKLLFDAFCLNNTDYDLLYYLGYDYMSNDGQRGCGNHPDYALWCFNHAQDAANNVPQNDTVEKYLQKIAQLKEILNNMDLDSEKPVKVY